MEWEELRSLHLGSSRGSEAGHSQAAHQSIRERSQLKISARLGVWRKWQVKEGTLLSFHPPTHPTLPSRVRTAVVEDTAEL